MISEQIISPGFFKKLRKQAESSRIAISAFFPKGKFIKKKSETQISSYILVLALCFFQMLELRDLQLRNRTQISHGST
jgi:hypothetical protein